MRPTIIVSKEPLEADRRIIERRLEAFNDAKGGPSGYEPVAILIKADDGSTVGGLWGRFSYDWLFIELLVVPKELRGTGVGTSLLDKAELLARSRDCVGIWLDTHTFQAPLFYERHGYEVFGTLPEHPRGSSRYFFRKLLQ